MQMQWYCLEYQYYRGKALFDWLNGESEPPEGETEVFIGTKAVIRARRKVIKLTIESPDVARVYRVLHRLTKQQDLFPMEWLGPPLWWASRLRHSLREVIPMRGVTFGDSARDLAGLLNELSLIILISIFQYFHCSILS